MHFFIRSVTSVLERNLRAYASEVQSRIDQKIKQVVLDRIRQTTGALLPSVTAPEIVGLLLPGFEGSGSKKKKRGVRRS